MYPHLKKLMPFAGAMLLVIGCRKQDQSFAPGDSSIISARTQTQKGLGKFDSYILQSWYQLALQLTKETPGHTPPVAARNFAYMGVAVYEALVGEMTAHQSMVGQLNGLYSLPQRKYGNSYLAPVTANAALARITKQLFQNASATNLDKIDELEHDNEKMYAGQISEQIIGRSKDYGYSVADAIYNWSLTDGGDKGYTRNFPTDYAPPTGTDKWIATPPAYQLAMLPYWGSNRTMVAANGPGLIDPPAPPAFSTSDVSAFYQAANEVYQTGINRTAEEETIALYWDDGGGTSFPPGHNLAIALQAIRNHNIDLFDGAMVLAKVGIALNDGAIVCWRAKFNRNLLRPITFIQQYIDPNWTTLIPTPPFPTYTSGHSTFSGAAATVLTSEFGENVSFTDSTKISAGFSPRSFSSYLDYAREAAMSRLYGGIHYRFDNDEGLTCGQHIAANVEQLHW
ncbi:MAG: vanadium-dependent haloperoxidase [Flavisolibacter sp.]